MNKLVLIRHGESTWNKENRFTGWTDVELSERGISEAIEAGKVLKKEGFEFKVAYTSYLTRALRTLWLVLEQMDLQRIPVEKTWRLNEKHYGVLQGLNKSEMAEKYGDEQVLIWRRSYDVRPPALELDDPRHPRFDHRYRDLDPKDIPGTEALKDTVERIVPYWKEQMEPALAQHKQIVVAAHGNSLRGILKYLKNISDQDIVGINLPTGIPYVFEFDNQMNLQKDYFLGDPDVIKKLMDEVANQGEEKMIKRWVIPDIHGYVKTVTSLVNDIIKPTRYDELYFLGDYVDRGPDSKGVIDFIKALQKDEYNVTALKGNHEDFMVELYDAEKKSKNAWWHNFGNKKHKAWLEIGGKPTLASFNVSHIRDVPEDYIEWMRNLRHYVELDRFVLVHAGLNFKNENPYEDLRSMLWLREYEIKPDKIGGRRIIHGHVPVNMDLITQAIKNRAFKFIDLDNGPYLSGKDGFGNLVALELESMEMVIQYNMDI